jgi:hypothetical protein
MIAGNRIRFSIADQVEIRADRDCKNSDSPVQ